MHIVCFCLLSWYAEKLYRILLKHSCSWMMKCCMTWNVLLQVVSAARAWNESLRSDTEWWWNWGFFYSYLVYHVSISLSFGTGLKLLTHSLQIATPKSDVIFWHVFHAVVVCRSFKQWTKWSRMLSFPVVPCLNTVIWLESFFGFGDTVIDWLQKQLDAIIINF